MVDKTGQVPQASVYKNYRYVAPLYLRAHPKLKEGDIVSVECGDAGVKNIKIILVGGRSIQGETVNAARKPATQNARNSSTVPRSKVGNSNGAMRPA
jgi:bifunctional DNA-binding transcriptional regulator/antitoxin component of YhaV-PrlF toxin-antitoxin module